MASHGLRAAGAARKGGTPGEGSPFNPLLRFVKQKGRSARCGARPGAPPLDPARFFVKKRGKKLLLGQISTSPSPSPLGRVIQSVREADTLAAEWQLPREWERWVGPETSRGRHHPISVFLWGSTPFLWARPKKWGGNSSTNLKSSRPKRRVPPTPVKPISPLARRQTTKRKNRRKSPRSNDRGLSLSGFISRSGTRLSRPRPACRRPWRG